jgi:uncharacterized membrane protein YdfJ with MMPL/SSD domain
MAAQTAPQAVSPNRQVQLVTVALQGTPQDEAVVAALGEVRQRSADALQGSGLSIGYTGDVALSADSEEAFTDAERIVGIATVVLIVGLQLLIFRSPIAALFPIVSVGLVFTLAQSLIAAAGKLLDFEVGTELTTLLTVVLFGIGTDYILFLLFRFRERLRAGDDPRAAVATAVERVGQAIASAAGVVIIAFSAMLLASLGFFTTLGPSLAVAVALMLLAALTLIPALLALIGPRVFWPSRSWQRPPRRRCSGASAGWWGAARRWSPWPAGRSCSPWPPAPSASGRTTTSSASSPPTPSRGGPSPTSSPASRPGRSTPPRCTCAATSRWTRPPWPSWGRGCNRSRGSARSSRPSSAPTGGSGRSTCC